MMRNRVNLLAVLLAIAASVGAALAWAQQVDPPALTTEQLAEIDRIFRQPTRQGWFDGPPVDPSDAEAFIEFLSLASGYHGRPTHLYKSVAVAPAHFAPAIREQLMRVPPTLEAYLEDRERHWKEQQYSTGTMGNLLEIMHHLDRASAEPILREFADAIRPLALQAKRRSDDAYARYRSAFEAAGRPVGDVRKNPELAPVLQEWKVISKTSMALSYSWGQTIAIARELGSPIFVDTGMAMLADDDPAVRRWGAKLASYVLKFADERPDGVAALRAAQTRLAQSENLEDQLAAVIIEIAMDPARKDLGTDPEYRRLRDQIRRQRQ